MRALTRTRPGRGRRGAADPRRHRRPRRPAPPTRRTTSWSSPRPPASGTTRSRPASRPIRDLGAANSFTVTATEDADRLHHGQPRPVRGGGLPQHHRRRAQRHPADRVRVLHPRRRRVRRRARRRRHRVRLAVLRRAGRRVLRLAPGDPAGHRPGRGPGARGHRAPAADLDPHRRVVQLPHQPPLHRARVLATLDESTLLRRRRWAPTTRTPGARPSRAAGPSTPAPATPRQSYAEPAFRAHLLGGIRYAAGRTKADCRPETGYTTLYNGSTTGWSQAGPGSFTNTDATLTSSGGHGPALVQRQAVHRLLAEAGLAAGRRRQLRRVHRLPGRQRPGQRLNNGYEVQIDATDAADRTTGAVYGVQVRRHRRPGRRAEPAGRVEHLRAAGRGRAAAGLPQRREDQRLHQHRPGTVADLRPHRHPEPRRRRRRVVPQHPDQGARAAPTPRTGPITGAAGKCVDVSGGGTADGTKVQLWTCTGSANQQWTVNGDTLRALGKCLDVAGGSTANGTQVQLSTCNGTGGAELDGRGQRLAGQPAVRQVPGRQRRQLRRRHPADHLDLPRRHQPTLDPSVKRRGESARPG